MVKSRLAFQLAAGVERHVGVARFAAGVGPGGVVDGDDAVGGVDVAFGRVAAVDVALDPAIQAVIVITKNPRETRGKTALAGTESPTNSADEAVGFPPRLRKPQEEMIDPPRWGRSRAVAGL